MTGKEHTIFKSYLFLTREEEKDWRKSISEWLSEEKEERGYTDEDLDIDSEVVSEYFYNDIWDIYDCEKANLNKTLPNKIIAIADMGLWDGRRSGYQVFGNNLNEVLYSGNCDDIYVYCDRYDVCSVMAHHDGRHYVTYRMVKDGVDIDNFLDKVYNGTYTKKDITRYTKSLRPYVKAVYGWK
jgi:hypothetical protein